ncbi:hypothetical protein D3C77_602820 [compost metagenome]
MDRVQAVVAVVLFDRVLAGVAMATEDLNRQLIGLEAELGRPGFDNRRQQVEQLMGLLAQAFSLAALGFINKPRSVQAQVEGAFDIGFLRQQHAFHIGMANDRYGGCCRILVVWQAALRALTCVFK